MIYDNKLATARRMSLVRQVRWSGARRVGAKGM
jgi:hypothetical protein